MPGLPVRLAVLLSLYMAQGLPTGIFNQALPAILRAHGVSLTVIGLTSLLGAPWALKALWAPWVDRRHWPHVGRSRSWILPLQAAGVVLIFLLADFDPESLRQSSGLIVLFAAMLILNLLAATQDIASDALAVRSLAPGERAAGNSVQVAGYRIGLILGGGLLLYLLGAWSWSPAFLLLGALLILLTIPVAFYREPVAEHRDSTDFISNRDVFTGLWRDQAFRDWLPVLLTYKVAEGFGAAMVKPMLVDMGFNLQQLGLQITVLGSSGTIFGALLGGWWMRRAGRGESLLFFGVFQALGLGGYALLSGGWLDAGPANPSWTYALNFIDHVAAGLATVALLTVVMDHSRHAHAGADFTVQVSLLALTGGLAHMIAGSVAQGLGYTGYYLLAMCLGLALLWPVRRWRQRSAASTRV